jgi:hypothetical protein
MILILFNLNIVNLKNNSIYINNKINIKDGIRLIISKYQLTLFCLKCIILIWNRLSRLYIYYDIVRKLFEKYKYMNSGLFHHATISSQHFITQEMPEKNIYREMDYDVS